MTRDTILSAIGSTEPSTFKEFCQALGRDCPEDKSDWRELFQTLRELEDEGYVDVEREGPSITSLQRR